MEKSLPCFSPLAESVVIGGTYEHYKGLQYKIIGLARHSETLEEMVVYQALYGKKDIWVRPLGMFFEPITCKDQSIPRFKFVKIDRAIQVGDRNDEEPHSPSILTHFQKDVSLKGPKLPLVSARLILRDFVPEDISQIIDIANHARFTGYLRFHPENISDSVESYIEEAIEMQKTDLGDREVFRLAVCLKESPSHVIGCSVFHGWNTLPDDNDQIGYFIHPEHQGYGYATEALNCLLTAYFSQYPEKDVEAIVHPHNLASQRVLKKLGFAQTGEKEIDAQGRREPRLIYTLRGAGSY